MPRRTVGRALAEKRPYLLASIAAALAFYIVRWGSFPELYLVPVKGASVALLAVYLRMRHSSPDARLMSWAFAAAALGDMALEIDRTAAALPFFASHMIALCVYLRNRRESLAPTQKHAVAAMLLLTPLIAWLLPVDRSLATTAALYALALGAMAAAAWGSTFPRYRVGAGAVLFLLSHLLLIAEMGPLQGNKIPQIAVWPLYYLGQLLIATGIAQTLRKRDPELRLVRGT
jgi:uncharacterized membrane protein YhhN